MRNGYKILVGKPDGKTSLRRSRNKLEDNIKMYLKEIACTETDCLLWLKTETSSGLL
jgi:hypothetical protein